MKMERLGSDKIRIFLTFDDLMERGIHKDDMWKEIPKVHELFSEMMDQANSELGFDASGPLAVEVFALPAQGMVVIVTRGKIQPGQRFDGLEDEEEDDVYEMEVTLEETDLISYAFHDFEHLVDASKLLQRYVPEGGRLYAYKNKYVLHIDPALLEEGHVHSVVAILSEFGEAASVTEAVLEEYGRLVIDHDAVTTLNKHF